MKKVLLIYGGKSSEHDVSCKSAKAIMDNIDNKYILDSVLITKDNVWLFNDKPILNIIEFIKQYDVIFPILHGLYGEDGKLQGMLDLFDIKYVGSKCGPSYLCIDKERTKQVLKYYNIPQVPFQIYEKNKKITIPYPIIVKPANGGSSIGISIANDKKELNKAIKLAKKYDNKIILEQFLNNPIELECAVLEDKVILTSNVGEISHKSNFYDYETKYNSKDTNTKLKANIDEKIELKIKEYAIKAFKALELNSLARIDFFYHNGNIYLNEINTLPGFTEISMYPQLFMDFGISYKELITKLIENAK
ncbi:MAG: D-alanine--D-alanine ligase [Firmicutes bacterium]|nr:D-alanine--D-alanine ligase [Bacillota bacterium]